MAKLINKRLRKVMVFGAFDALHPGHLDFFSQAKKFGEFLIVSVGTDKNVAKIKGKKPLFDQDERLELVKQCRLVDLAVLGDEADFWGHIKKYNPEVICLGYDQWASEEEVRKNLFKVGLSNIQIVRLKAHREKRAKSTIVKKHSVDF